MGLYSTAELIWGVPIVAWDDGEPTTFWDDENGDWREFESLEVRAFGHYEDPDNERAILTWPTIPRFSGDCWDPTLVPARELDVEAYRPDAVDLFTEALDDIDPNLVEKRGWYLVASVG